MTIDTASVNTLARRAHDGVVLFREPMCALAHDEVRFRVLRAAICGTDRQIMRGDRSDGAVVLGHEGVAVVDAVGSAAAGHSVGERVVFNPVNPRDQDEILGHSTPGLFQRYLTLRALDIERRSLVVRASGRPCDDLCVLAEPLGTVVYTHELLRALPPRSSLLVIGAGPIGILHAQYAALVAGVARVRLVCNSEARHAWLARHLAPAVEVVPWPTTELDVADAILVCVPARAAVAAIEVALVAVAPRGCIGLVGGVRQPVAALPGHDLAAVRRRNVCGEGGPAAFVPATTRDGKEVLLFGQRGTAARHLATALDLLTLVPTLGAVLTHRVSLGALPVALAAVAAGTPLAGAHCVKVLVDCSRDDQRIDVLPRGVA